LDRTRKPADLPAVHESYHQTTREATGLKRRWPFDTFDACPYNQCQLTSHSRTAGGLA